jgi:biopolymer transport protein ExbB/TolQ
MHSFSVIDMWGSMTWLGRAVVMFLALMSLYSVGVMIERMLTYSAGASESLRYVAALREHLVARRIDAAIQAARQHGKSPIARMMHAGLCEYQSGASRGPGTDDLADAVYRALERVKERETALLRKGLGVLGTVASSAPFVGLFGTVVGIINAFGRLSGGGGLDVVGPGISEALVATAFGLLVAIPAVMFFNYFTGRVELFVVDMNDVSAEFVDYVLKEKRPS